MTMTHVLHAVNRISPMFSLVQRGASREEIDTLSRHLHLTLPPSYMDFTSTFGGISELRLIPAADFTIPGVLKGLEEEDVDLNGLIPIGYESGGASSLFVTLAYETSGGPIQDDPKVYLTHVDDMAWGGAGRLVSNSFTRFVAVGLSEWMVCPSFKYFTMFAPEINLKYVQVCRVVNIDMLISSTLYEIGYNEILPKFPVYSSQAGGIVVYNRCPNDHTFRLSVGAGSYGAVQHVRDTVQAALKAKLKETR